SSTTPMPPSRYRAVSPAGADGRSVTPVWPSPASSDPSTEPGGRPGTSPPIGSSSPVPGKDGTGPPGSAGSGSGSHPASGGALPAKAKLLGADSRPATSTAVT